MLHFRGDNDDDKVYLIFLLEYPEGAVLFGLLVNSMFLCKVKKSTKACWND